MMNVVRQQVEVIKRFKDLAGGILRLSVSRALDIQDMDDRARDERVRGDWKMKLFEKRAADLSSDMSIKVKELEGLIVSAKSTSENVSLVASDFD